MARKVYTKLLKTKREYKEAMARMEKVFHAKKGTPESHEADILALVIKEYEDRKFHVKSPVKVVSHIFRVEWYNRRYKSWPRLGNSEKTLRKAEGLAKALRTDKVFMRSLIQRNGGRMPRMRIREVIESEIIREIYE